MHVYGKTLGWDIPKIRGLGWARSCIQHLIFGNVSQLGFIRKHGAKVFLNINISQSWDVIGGGLLGLQRSVTSLPLLTV
jgi:hypothetical protein